MSPIIQQCVHCLDKVAGKSRFCRNCRTIKKRLEMDKINKEHFKSLNLTFECDFCDLKIRK